MFTRTTFLSALAAVAVASPVSEFLSKRQITNASDSDWDYIVVGGGPAGIISATRFAESGHRVLLLERGGPSTQSSGGNASMTWDGHGLTPYDVPSQQGSIFSLGAGETCDDVPGTAGCLLGGGVSINAMIFIKPPKHDFDDKWPTGWKWRDVAHSAETFYSMNPPTIAASMDGVVYDPVEYEILGSFLENTLGYCKADAVQDPHKKEKVYSYPPWNIHNGERFGPVRSYLPRVMNSTNFALQSYTTVLRVIRDGSHITGVEVNNTSSNTRSIINLSSNGRVVLAAGSMRTPAILINSGIGPVDQIEVVANGTTNITLPSREDWISLPVGTQIKDHPIVTLKFDVPSSLNMTYYNMSSPLESDKEKYLANRTGILTQNYQRLIFWQSFVGPDNVKRYVQGTTGPAANNTFQIKLYLTHGLTSVGQLGIQPDGATYFMTEPYFTDDADSKGLASFIDSFIASVKNSTSWTQSPSASGNGTTLLAAYTSGTHFVGTAKLGTDSGLEGGESVVDLDTKVYGTDNLFVVDASIHPDLPTGNTMAIVMLVAENSAKRILALSNAKHSAKVTLALSAKLGE